MAARLVDTGMEYTKKNAQIFSRILLQMTEGIWAETLRGQAYGLCIEVTKTADNTMLSRKLNDAPIVKLNGAV